MRAPQSAALEQGPADQSQLTFDLAVDPMSFACESEASAAFTRALAPDLGQVPFLITAPVCLTIACKAVPSPWHPDAVVYPNLETWLRPLIDTLSGADRLLVSPSLVGVIRVTTRRPEQAADALSITLTYPPDRVLMKKPLHVVAV